MNEIMNDYYSVTNLVRASSDWYCNWSHDEVRELSKKETQKLRTGTRLSHLLAEKLTRPQIQRYGRVALAWRLGQHPTTLNCEDRLKERRRRSPPQTKKK